MFRHVTTLGTIAVIATATGSSYVNTATPELGFKTVNLTTRATTVITEAHADDSGSALSPHIQFSIRNGGVKSRGVNLGGWLVTEHWMTPEAEFYNGLSNDAKQGGEYAAITKAENQDTTRALIKEHHETFITEADIKAIADAGLNTVRVPVGYWIVGFDNDDSSNQKEWAVYTKGTLKYLDVLIRQWAKTYNVAVLVSIHAAKGSQNGQDHSSPAVQGKSYWSDYPENVANTVTLAKFLADRYKDDAAFLGLGPMNEPALTTNEAVLYKYYEDVYKAIRATGNDCVLSVAPLLYKQNPETMIGFMQAPQYTNVWVEWHPYFVWGYEQISKNDLINVSVKKEFQGKVNKWHARQNHNRLFFGEWSFATSNNKFGDDKNRFYEFAEAQAKVQNQAEGGWTFWSWKVSGDSGYHDWSLRSVLRDAKLKKFLLGN